MVIQYKEGSIWDSYKTNLAYAPMEACINGGGIIGRPTPQWSIVYLSVPLLT